MNIKTVLCPSQPCDYPAWFLNSPSLPFPFFPFISSLAQIALLEFSHVKRELVPMQSGPVGTHVGLWFKWADNMLVPFAGVRF